MPRKLGPLLAAAVVLTALLPASASAFSFAPAQIVTAGPAQQEMFGVASADVDGDGRLDAVASGYYSAALGGDPTIAVLRGRANGTLAPALNYPMTAAGPVTGIALGDFDEDGSPDAALGSPFGEDLILSLNDGNGAFLAPTPLPSGGFSPDDPLVADFDADGNLDLASANGSSYSVYLGNGNGSFEPVLNEEIDDWALTIASGDFDDDGTADLALGNVDAGTVRVLLGDGDGTFTPLPPVDLEALEPDCFCVEIWGIAAGDLDADGRDDLVLSDRFENRLFSVISNADGTLTAKGPFTTGNEGNPISVELGDLDADGELDAVTADYIESTGTILAGNGDGTFTAVLEVESGDLPYGNAIADIDADGKLDLLYADQGLTSGQVTLVRNVGQPAALIGPSAGIDFGDQPQQTLSAPRAVTVTNTGDALLHVTGALLEGFGSNQYLVSAGECIAAPIASGQACAVTVRFSPSAAGASSAAVRVLSDAPGASTAITLAGNGTSLPAGPPGPAGPAGTPGAQGPAGPQGPSAPLALALASKQLRARAGKAVKLSFATTLPGKATLTVKPGGPTLTRTLKAAGTGTLTLKLRKPGSYKLRLGFRAGDGQTRSANATLVVTG